MMSVTAKMIVDGSVLEGGGQILRNSVAYSALLRKPIAIENIRQNRKPPGLKPQHAAGTPGSLFKLAMLSHTIAKGLRLAAHICSGQLTGCEPKSTSIDLVPGQIQTPGSYTADPGTAGSTTLLLQISYPCLVFSQASEPSEITVRGGTNAAQAPQIDYTDQVFLPFLRQHLGLAPKLTIRRRGYYPRGGGEVHLNIPPTRGPLPPVNLTERGAVKYIFGRAYVAGYPARMADEIRAAAVDNLVSAGLDPKIIRIDSVRERDTEAFGKGSGVVLWAETEGGCRLGGSSSGLRGQSLASLGDAAASELVRNIDHGGCVDEYLQV